MHNCSKDKIISTKKICGSCFLQLHFWGNQKSSLENCLICKCPYTTSNLLAELNITFNWLVVRAKVLHCTFCGQDLSVHLCIFICNKSAPHFVSLFISNSKELAHSNTLFSLELLLSHVFPSFIFAKYLIDNISIMSCRKIDTCLKCGFSLCTLYFCH